MSPVLTTREQLRRLERFEIDTPLGLRFWDPLTASIISDGLIVNAFRKSSPDWSMAATPNHSGVFVFHPLSVRGEPPAAPLTVSDLVVTVCDPLGRFQPYKFPIVGPARGLFDWADLDLSPLAAAPGLPLFSSPARPVPAGMAVVRAELRQADPEQAEGLKASWAVMDVIYKGKLLGRGMADRDGRLAVILPYPPPAISSTGSGVPGPTLPLQQQTWTIEIAVCCHPAVEESAWPDEATLSRHPEKRFPDLSEVLSSPQVTLQDPTTPGSLPGTLSLTYGQETIIRTLGKSELFFTNP